MHIHPSSWETRGEVHSHIIGDASQCRAASAFMVTACPGLRTAQSSMTHSLLDILHTSHIVSSHGMHTANTTTFSTVGLSDFAKQN